MLHLVKQHLVKKEIIVVTNATPKPFNYEENGELTGYEIEVVRAILKILTSILSSLRRQSGQVFLQDLMLIVTKWLLATSATLKNVLKKYLYAAPTAKKP